MPFTQATVAVRDTTTGETSTRTFDRSPILIGRGPWNALSLESPEVALLHGEIWFRPGFAAYLNLASQMPTLLDGRPLASGELVPLTSRATLVIGQYGIHVVRPSVSIDHDGPSAAAIRSISSVTRALAVMANFASPLLELRRHLLLPIDTASVDSDDPYEVVRSLLASSGPESPTENAPMSARARHVQRSHRRSRARLDLRSRPLPIRR